ncbi:hypothetical protein Tco_0771836 [Tanacetum coccineum]|uniref:Uncharacterized protein n=1 Tax=Tanacetum coccineum TaxID=301880 RepID=A0ABQ4ZJK8_9ASTR
MKDKMVYKGNNVVGALMNVPIFVETFYVVTDFAVLEEMDVYRDEGMGDVIIVHEDNEREELYEVHELPVCKVRRYMMIKYSFNNDEEDVVVKEDEYDDLTITRKEACRAYQEIFRIMNE